MDNTQIFSGLEERYQKYRPSYPALVLDSLRSYVEAGRDDSWRGCPLLIDVGAGTGILTRQLCERFSGEWRCVGIEPGSSMRGRAQVETGSPAGIHYVGGSAEEIPLRSRLAALTIAAQAAHWFDRPRFYAEAERVLLRGGTLALLYNDRDRRRSALLAAYDEFLESRTPKHSRADRAGDGALVQAGSGLRDLRGGGFERELCGLDGFDDFRRFSVEWARAMSADEFIGMCLSTVHFRRAINEADEAVGIAILREMIAKHCEDPEHIVVPYSTTLLAVRRSCAGNRHP